jgi:vitamin B12 transporter
MKPVGSHLPRLFPLVVSVILPSLALLPRVSAQSPSAPPVIETTVDVYAEPVPFDLLAGSVNTFTREDIAASGARDAAEFLRFVANVHLSQSGTKGSLSTLTIRGGKPNFTLVLIDGIPANDIGDQLGGAFNFATLDIDSIERIDIFRGPLSTVYGSNAISGVVNIVLRRPDERPRFHITVDGGQYGYAFTSGGASWVHGKTGLAAGGSFSRIGQQVLNDDSMLGTANALVDHRFSNDRSIDAFVRWNRLSDSQLPVSSGGPLYALTKTPEINMADQVSAGGTLRHSLTPRFSYDARAGIFSRVASDNSPAIIDSIPPGPSYVPSSLSDNRFLRIDLLSTQQYAFRPWATSYSSVSWLHESGTSVGSLGGYLPANYKLLRDTFNASGTGILARKRGSITAGLNVQQSSDYDVKLSPRVGGTWSLSGYQLHFSYGQGFKLPSFYSLGNPLVGNPTLHPETGRTYDAGVSHTFSLGHTRAALTYFDNKYDNLIDFSPSLFKLVNRSSAYARGGDLDVSSAFHHVVAGGSVTYVDAGLIGTSDRLRDVPRWSEALHLRFILPRQFIVQADTVWVGRRFDYQVPVPEIATVPRYTLTAVRLEHRFSSRIAGHVRLENMLNSGYQESVGFPSPGIYTSAGLSYSH